MLAEIQQNCQFLLENFVIANIIQNQNNFANYLVGCLRQFFFLCHCSSVLENIIYCLHETVTASFSS